MNHEELGEIDGIDMWKTISENTDSPRTQLIHNIDDIYKYAALRDGNWKYVTGTSANGRNDGWYGSTGKDELYKYDTAGVLTSETASVIAGLLTHKQIQMRKENSSDFYVELLNAEKLADIRHSAQIQCPNRNLPIKNKCSPNESPCLFNLQEDPCERNNLALENPNIVKSLEEIIEKYRKTAIKPRNIPRDPNADPAKYNNTWTNWMDWEDVQKQRIAYQFLSPLAIGLISAACFAFLVVILIIAVKSHRSQKSSRPSSVFDDPLDQCTTAMAPKAQMFEERELTSMRNSFKDALKSVE